MKEITFSYNWNNKLNCNAFTTLRIEQPNKYIVGADYHIVLKKEQIAVARIVNIKSFFLKDLNEFIAYLDTGYSLDKCRQIILNMYPNVNFLQKRLSLILLLKHPAT